MHTSYFKEHLVSSLSGLLIGIFIAVLFIDNSMELKDYIKVSSIFFATFFGATFAFMLNENKENRKEYISNLESLNFALFTLTRQLNSIESIERRLNDYKTDFELAFNMPAYQNPEYSDLKQKLDSLTFILKSSNPTILLELSIEEERFEQAMESIKIRNEFYVKEYQVLLEKHKLNNQLISQEELKNILGERVYEACVQSAIGVKEHISKCKKSIPEMQTKILKLAKEIFPGEKFLKWEAHEEQTGVEKK